MKDNKNIIIAIIACVAIVAILAVGAIFIAKKDNEDKVIEDAVTEEVVSKYASPSQKATKSNVSKATKSVVATASESEDDGMVFWADKDTRILRPETETQYVLGEGVHIRKSADQNAPIMYTIYDLWTPIEVVEEGKDWYTVLYDDTIGYINSRYVGDEDDIEYVKEKRAAEAKRKSSAYYNVFKNMTDADYKLLSQILAIETNGEPWEGKLAVVEVIMNRVISKDPDFPDTVTGVLKSPGQFTSLKHVSNSTKVTQTDLDAIEYVRNNGATALRKILDKNGMTNINSLDMVFFGRTKENGVDFVKIGNHWFSRSSKKQYHHKVWR